MLDLGELSAKLKVDSSEGEKGLEGFGDKLKSFGGVAGPAMAGAGLAAGAAFIASTMAAIDQEAIADVAAAAYANPEQAKQAGDIAGKLYAGGWGEGLADVNEAVNSVLTSIGDMEDASDADIQTMTAHVMDLSKVMGIDVPRAAQVVGQAVSSHLAKDSTEAIDLLTKSLQIVPTNLREDLLDAVDEYGPFLAGIGIKGERAFGLLAHAAQKGMYGIDKTGDALKEFTIRATDGSTSTAAAYKAIGLDAGKMATAVAGGGDKAAAAFQKTVDGLLKIKDPAKQAQAAIGLFGTPLEDLSVQDLPKFLESLDLAKGGMGGFKDSAKQLSDTVNDNAATSIESFKRQVTQTFVNLLGNNVLPVVKTVAAYLANNFGPAMQDVGTFISTSVMPYLRQFGEFIAGRVIPVLRQLAHEYLAEARRQLGEVAASFRENRPQIQQFVTWIKQAAIWVGQHLVPVLRAHLVGGLKVTGAAIKGTIAIISAFVDHINGTINAVKAMARAVQNGTHSVLQFFRDMSSRIESTVDGLGDRMYSAGVHIIDMLTGGMASKASAAYSKMKSIVSGLAKLIPGSPVREGPLRSLNNGRAGALIVDMLAEGMRRRTPVLLQAFTGAVTAPVRTMPAGRGYSSGGTGRLRTHAGTGVIALKFEGSNARTGKAILSALRPALRFEGLEGALG